LTDAPPASPFGERYERLGILGRGGQGIVYRAFDRWVGRPVAIKVLTSVARKPQMAERLVREQQALSALKGTAAVEVLDIYRGPSGELCLVMELLVGTDLEGHLTELEDRGEKLAPTRIAQIFEPIVHTLEVAHQSGILHRDLKPANIFLLDDGGVRLLDFGMARLKKSAPLTAAGTVMGSPSFMAPEAWKGRSDLVDHRADVYSLGVILFRVLAGELPFSGETLVQKMLGATTETRPSIVAKRPDLPRDADEWVALALAIDREQRFQNVRALWNAFLATFRIARPSFWAAARDKLKEMARFGPESAPADSHSSQETWFARQALAGSVMHLTDPELTAELSEAPAPVQALDPAPGENTLELSQAEVVVPVEKTLELSASELVVPVEKTLELSESELVVREQTQPIPVRPPPPPRK
jgi:eukaryotic-like serine/threonine-protein kinase